jgi:hypothetical protein
MILLAMPNRRADFTATEPNVPQHPVVERLQRRFGPAECALVDLFC